MADRPRIAKIAATPSTHATRRNHDQQIIRDLASKKHCIQLWRLQSAYWADFLKRFDDVIQKIDCDRRHRWLRRQSNIFLSNKVEAQLKILHRAWKASLFPIAGSTEHQKS
jgi:hypothetical protein